MLSIGQAYSQCSNFGNLSFSSAQATISGDLSTISIYMHEIDYAVCDVVNEQIYTWPTFTYSSILFCARPNFIKWMFITNISLVKFDK
jgi:hypothetical protein